MIMQHFTMGADPELFVKDKSTGEFVPIIDRLGGTKEAPMPVHKGAVQEDGCAAEFNIKPATSRDEFIRNINIVKDQLEDMLAEQGLEISYDSEVEFQDHLLTDPRARVSGCDPDYNVYTNKMNKYPPMEETNKRCAGGHIHVGFERIVSDPTIRDEFIKMCDMHIGAPLLAIATPTSRVDTYGKLGNYRPKPYGVEYRSPSNFWLQDDALIGWMYDRVEYIRASVGKTHTSRYVAAYAEKMNGYIVKKNYKGLRKLCEELSIAMPEKKNVRRA